MRSRILSATFAVAIAFAFCPATLALPVYNTSTEGVAFTVRDTAISIEIVNNLVQTTIEQTVFNPSDRDCPCTVTVAVPRDSHITSFSAIVNGKHFRSTLMKREEAQKVFDAAKAAGEDAALASEGGDGLHIELTPVKAGSTFTFKVCFVKQADYADGYFEFALGITDKQDPIWSTVHSKLEMACTVPILSVESKTHSLSGAVEGKKARFEFSGAPQNSGDIALRWQLELLPGKPVIVLRDCESEDPFFSLICLPPDIPTFDDPRSVVILLDKSGSMAGEKYDVACESTLKFIDRLRDTDIFNLVLFDTACYYAAPDPFKADKNGKEAAAAFLRQYRAANGTRFLQPVIDSLKKLHTASNFRPSMLLISDGGDNVDRAAAFYKRITKEVGFDIPIYTFAIGNGADMPLMRCLAENSGASISTIMTASEIPAALAKMALRFENTAVTDFGLSFPKDTVYDCFPRKQARLYKGEPLVLCGRVRDESKFSLTLQGIATSGNWFSPVEVSTVSESNDCAFLPKVWAALKMSESLDRIEMFGSSKELVDEVIAISLRCSISSPYTSFVVVCTEDGNVVGPPTSEGSPSSDDTIGALGLGGGPAGAHSQHTGGKKAHKTVKSGGTPASESSVDLGLKWLADHQEADGHWDTKKWGGNGDYDPGITGLALLAFAGAGHTERSGKFRRVVKKAIDWLASQQDAKGNFAPRTTMYNHAIPTLALLEEVAMAPVPRTQAIAKKALDYMISVQNDYKAWRYWPKDNDNDVSVTSWCVMAMKAAKVAGFDVPAGSWAGVKNFLDEVTEPNSGEVGYTARPIKAATEQPYQRYSMTACGMLCRLYMGVSRDDKLIKNGTIILMENLPEWDQPGIGAPFFYYWYFGSMVLFQVEGDPWKKWNVKMRDMLVQHQNMTPGDLNGSWDPSPNTHFCNMGGRVYATAMATLCLEVYYRYEIMSKP
ncbi:MAG: VIT domain-containing protein [Candidatus Brocadiia bacterium]